MKHYPLYYIVPIASNGVAKNLKNFRNYLSQIARRVNSANRVYAEDMEDMMRQQQELWLCANKILKRLASLG
jgi:hypothetical protein